MCPFWLGRITVTYTLLFWAPFSFWEAYFCKVKGRETLNSQNNLNTTDNNVGLTGLTESLASTELWKMHRGI
jgi:hypothetical protein